MLKTRDKTYPNSIHEDYISLKRQNEVTALDMKESIGSTCIKTMHVKAKPVKSTLHH